MNLFSIWDLALRIWYTKNMRDDAWLFQKLDEIWDRHFSDIPQQNDVIIKFGRKARQRLGSIKQETINNHGKSKNFMISHTGCGGICSPGVCEIFGTCNKRKTIITINGLFKDLTVPEYVITATIAHEMCHYAHGFSSPLDQKFENPHQGGIVTREMKARGFDKELAMQKKWLKEVWPEYLKQKMPYKQRRRRRRRVTFLSFRA